MCVTAATSWQNDDLNDRTHQTVSNVKQTVETMNQLAMTVQNNTPYRRRCR
jgi:methyl-accepting chemotaxis protein